MAYHLWKIITAEYNYGIGNKELLAIINAFWEWRPLLYKALRQTRILSDYLNL